MHSKNTNAPKGDGAKSTQLPNSNHRRNPTSDSLNSSTTTTTTKWRNDQSAAIKNTDVGNSSSSPPLKETMPSFTGDKEGKLKLEDKSGIGGIGGWFAGSSPPVTIAVSGEERASVVDRQATLESGQSSASKGTVKRSVSNNMPSSEKTVKSTPTPAASPSRFAFFSRATTPTAPKVTQVSSNLQDEWLNLDITTALFPNGPTDPFSPSSFKNLLTNAENLLRKLQAAYKERTVAVHELTREKEAQADELEEAETRAEHLKRQLEDMGKKLVQQDHDILSISNELAAEKQLRAEEKSAHESGLQNLKVDSESSEANRAQASLVSRGSRSSFESYNLEDNDSVFSHYSRSHTSTSSAGTGITTPEIIALDSDKASIMSTRTTPRNTSMPQRTSTKMAPPPPPQQKSVFTKLLGGGGNTSAPDTSQLDDGLGLSETGCANCRGGSSSVAWDAVGLLRAENKGLKDRVGLLESGVDDALHLVSMRSLR